MTTSRRMSAWRNKTSRAVGVMTAVLAVAALCGCRSDREDRMIDGHVTTPLLPAR